MRALARELGVPPMTIYHYAPSREYLHALVVDDILSEIRVPGTNEGDWEERLRRLLHDARRVFAEHPGVSAHFGDGGSDEGARLADGVLTILADGGFSPQSAVVCFTTLFTFMTGQIDLDAMSHFVAHSVATATLDNVTRSATLLARGALRARLRRCHGGAEEDASSAVKDERQEPRRKPADRVCWQSGYPGIDMQVRDVTFDWADLSAVPEAVSVVGSQRNSRHRSRDADWFSRRAAGDLRPQRSCLEVGQGLASPRDTASPWCGRATRSCLWVSDPGFVFEVGPDDGDEEWSAVFGRGVHVASRPPRVVKMTLDGEILVDLPIPPREPESPPGMMGDYCPCGTAIDEERFGGNGDIWVADGYGSSLVHRFDSQGNHRSTLTGEEGADASSAPTPFSSIGEAARPRNSTSPTGRTAVFRFTTWTDKYLRTFGDAFSEQPKRVRRMGRPACRLPSCTHDSQWLTLMDNFIGYVGATDSARTGTGWPERPGWPNVVSSVGRVERAHPPTERIQLSTLTGCGRRWQPLRFGMAHRWPLHQTHDRRVAEAIDGSRGFSLTRRSRCGRARR